MSMVLSKKSLAKKLARLIKTHKKKDGAKSEPRPNVTNHQLYN